VILLAAAGAAGVRAAVSASSPSAAPSTTPRPAPTANPTATTAATPAPLPVCSFGDLEALDDDLADWAHTLVDTTYRLPQGYRPPDLATVTGAGFTGVFEVRAFVLHDLAALRRAAAADGHPIAIEAAYRSYRDQAKLFTLRENELGYQGALAKTARPGHSEHQLGTTIDFKTDGDDDVDRSWASTPTGKWMEANAYRFGFVLSYPPAVRDVTCYAYEPWHFRYFGREVAAQIQASGFTAREFLWQEEQEAPTPA
jgi:D-alanyl-D-alanine carboxypeptidase